MDSPPDPRLPLGRPSARERELHRRLRKAKKGAELARRREESARRERLEAQRWGRQLDEAEKVAQRLGQQLDEAEKALQRGDVDGYKRLVAQHEREHEGYNRLVAPVKVEFHRQCAPRVDVRQCAPRVDIRPPRRGDRRLACGRPAHRRASRSTSRAGSSDDDGESEPAKRWLPTNDLTPLPGVLPRKEGAG
jgi:hypothetical protein